MKASDYWRGRFEQLEESLLKQGLETYDDIEKQYRLAMQNIEKDISVWYKRLAANNDISYAEAQKLFNKNELKEFHWTVEEYIKKGKENSISQVWAKQLENASAKVHISRLEAMKLQMQQHLEVLYGNQLDSIDGVMRSLYSEGYYRTAYEVQKGLGVGYDLQKLDKNKISKVISKPWASDGKNFSDRIWTSKDKLVNTLHTELTQATIRGDSLEQVVRNISKTMNTSKSQAGRLVMTESAFFASASQKDCFSDLGVEQYEIIATLDMKTSSICRDMDGKVFKMSDFKPGITAPPFHCWCRSCTAPYFDDMKGTRAARGEDGKTYQVPSDMKYPEWKKSFIDNEKDGIIKSNLKDDGVIQVHKIATLDKGIYKCVTKDIVTDEVIITDERIGHIKENHPNDHERYCGYLAQIIKTPDYIVEANKPNTALILKDFSDGKEQFKTVLRLVTSSDNAEFKNSIITFMKINSKEWNRLIKNKQILYKRE